MKKEEIGLQIIELKGNINVNCNLHGKQPLVQCTKYGSIECKQCFEDIKKYVKEIKE